MVQRKGVRRDERSVFCFALFLFPPPNQIRLGLATAQAVASLVPTCLSENVAVRLGEMPRPRKALFRS